MKIRAIQEFEVTPTFHEGRSVLQVMDADGVRMCFAFDNDNAIDSLKAMFSADTWQTSVDQGVWEEV